MIDPKDVVRYERFLRYGAAMHDARESLVEFARFTSPHDRFPDDPDRSLFLRARHFEIMGKALEAVEERVRQPAKKREKRNLILNAPVRHGKACADDTPVLTPAGWRQHGDLAAGDTVFGLDGKPARVLGTRRWEPDMLRVTFSDGESVVVHRNHEWTVRDCGAGGRPFKTLETHEMAARGLWAEKTRARFDLPMAAPLEFPEAILPAHPYVLGAWLGDGAKDTHRIHGVDEEIFDAIEAAGYRRSAGGAHATTGVLWRDYAGSRRGPGSREQLSEQLHRLGLLGKKRIPELYLRASIDQRMQLLAGLIATDGSMDRRGRCRIVTAEPDLAEDILDLCRGLGFRSYRMEQAPHLSTSGIQGRRPAITIGFQVTREIPCRVPRKRAKRIARPRPVSIRAIEPATASGCQSIQVDRADGLYLVGKTLLPTHNTLFATQKMAAWFWGRNPDLELMMATYGDKFAKQYRADVATNLRSQRFRQAFPDFTLVEEGSDELLNHLGKRQYYLGRRSPTNGRGFNLGLIDDPIKDDREAKFQAYRDDVWEWLIYTLMNRAHDDRACLVITSARWHEDDIVGRLTDPTNPAYPREVAETFELINLPALAVDDDDLLGRKPGEALWPERHSAEALGKKARDMPVMFSALFQGNPTPAEGVFYHTDDLRTYSRRDLPTDLRYYGASDHAVSTKQTADRTCAGIFGISSDGYAYIMPDLCWRKIDADIAVEEMIRLMRTFNPLWWYAEAGHITRSIGPFLAKRMQEELLAVPIVEEPAIGDKVQRAQSARARCSQGRILFPEEAPWWPAAKDELLKFPNGRHDDFVDFLSIIGMKLEMHVSPGRTRAVQKGPPPGSWAALKAQFTEQDRQAARRPWQ